MEEKRGYGDGRPLETRFLILADSSRSLELPAVNEVRNGANVNSSKISSLHRALNVKLKCYF
jgi:hypothetical protein